jgi:hypothetical protein
MTKLELLDLGLCEDLCDAGLVHLQGLSRLRELTLRSTKVTDAGLVHLRGVKGLESLDLRYTKVTDAGLAHLAPLTRLRTLDLRGTNVTGPGVRKLNQTLPKVRILHSAGPQEGVRLTGPKCQ